MLDRASTFANPEIIKALKNQFIPVAIDQAYQRRQKDAEGEFYRKIASQSPRNNFQGTTQGLFIASADGTFLGFSNHRAPERIQQMINNGLKKFSAKDVEVISADKLDPRYNPQPPKQGLVVRVHAKVLDGYEETDNKWQKIFQSAVSRDNLWINASETRELINGKVPRSLQERIARFHLVDNTRGEPPMWRADEIQDISMNIKDGILTGKVKLKTKSGDRGYECNLYGHIATKDSKVTRFDLVARGEFWGEGPFTRNAPKGRFPLAVAFSLADGSDVADGIPPQASRGWVPGYIKMER